MMSVVFCIPKHPETWLMQDVLMQHLGLSAEHAGSRHAQSTAAEQIRLLAQTSACSAPCYTANGIMSGMQTLAALLSGLIVTGRFGGNVISAQMAILTNGKQ